MQPKYSNYLSSKSTIHETVELEMPVRLYGHVMLRKNTKIGQFSFVNDRTTFHSDSVMGRFCSVGKNVEIGPFDHPMERLSTSPVSYNAHLHFPNEKDLFFKRKLSRKAGVTIGNDVWISSNCLITRGLTIGDGAVIGAGSIVLEDVAPYSIVVGSPAKEIRRRFDDNTIERLLKAKWWNRDISVLGKLAFDDIESCLASLEGKTDEEETDKSDVVEALRETVNSIDADYKKPVSVEKQEFMKQLLGKLAAANAQEIVIDLIANHASRINHDYSAADPYDQIILNNKISHITELTQSLEKGGEITKELQDTVLNILSTKD